MGESRHPAMTDNYPTFSYMPWPYQSTKWFAINQFQMLRGT